MGQRGAPLDGELPQGSSYGPLTPSDCPPGMELQGDPPPVGRSQRCVLPQAQAVAAGVSEPGPFRAWHDNGVLQAAGTGTFEGVRTFSMWYANGNPQVHGRSWGHGREGLVRSWHLNGHIATEAYFRDGKEEGPYRSWWEEGTLSAEGNFLDGWEEGAWTFWSPDGLWFQEGTYKRGMRHGWWSRWDLDGQPRFKLLYREGQEVAPGEMSRPQPAR